jgi:hypothetical protein
MKSRTTTRLGAALVGGTLLLGHPSARAAVTYSGVVDIPIPTTFAGVYLDLNAINGNPSTPSNNSDAVTADTYTIGYSEPASWDVNFFFGGIVIAYSPTFRPLVDSPVGNRAQILNVAAGTEISSAAVAQTVGTSNFGGSGHTNGTPGTSHFGTPTVDVDPRYSAFTPGVQGYIAFVLNPDTSPRYGWMSVTLTNNGTPGSIHEWAFSDSPTFTVAQVPESRAALFGGLGLLVLLRRRRG